SGGNVANMLGFWAARAAMAGWDVRQDGLRAEAGASLRVYATRGTHTWLDKALDLSGLGSGARHLVDTDADGRMDADDLERRVAADRAAGHRPFLVIGTAGSVATGVVDPLAALRSVCDRHGLWLHVDGAYGAFAAAAPNAPD